MASPDIPKDMTALKYSEPFKFKVVTVPVPEIAEHEVLLKVNCCGVCGNDGLGLRYQGFAGEFIAKFPLIPGHEVVGVVVKTGSKVHQLKIGERVVCDVGEVCGTCYFCVRGSELFCENFLPKGVAQDGGFADYVKFDAAKCFPIHNLSDVEATLLEPASCAVHGLDKLKPKVGSEALLIGAGPTGLILAQLLKLNGCQRVVLAANKGIKMDIARRINAADEYIELDRKDAKAQWADLKQREPYVLPPLLRLPTDRLQHIVVEATGVESIVNDAINYVKRGGKLMVYGVYADKARVSWSPTYIFVNEIEIIGSFSQTYCMPRAVAYLDSGKINVKGMVTDTFPIERYQDALDLMASRKALKIAIRPAGSQ